MLIPTLILAAVSLQPQVAATKPEVLFWPHGVSPLGIDHKDVFGNHGIQISHRTANGEVEVHQTKADVMVIQSGEATLVYGGEGVGMHEMAPNELHGTSIRGGASRHVEAGDIVHIPTGVPHQFFVEAGKQITYLVVKVVDPPVASASK